jgi:L-ascorbate metabolism protein UlaG (beta-lactamase superfamily)
MKKIFLYSILCAFCMAGMSQASMNRFVLETSGGPLTVTLIGHGTLMMEWKQQVIHIDPWSKLRNYDSLPDADLILLTHEHPDHLDKTAIGALQKSGTVLIGNGQVVRIL